MDLQTKKYLIGAASATAIAVIYFNSDYIFKLRQKWLASYIKKGGHGHSHSHSHSHGNHDGDKDQDHALKVQLFHQLPNEKISKAPGVRVEDGIRILEIGVGTGANFKYFPEKCLFVAVDPNPYFEENVAANLRKFSGIKLERRLNTGAEDMKEIPSNSVDVVIATFVFCQVNDVNQVFAEILRVLVPGGKFYYMDHLPGSTFQKIFGKVMTYTGLARLIFNANLTRDIGKTIQSAGFSDVQQKYVAQSKMTKLMGAAQK